MLEYLRIRNLALVEDIELEFGPGLNVLTGETGAGKSLILKALGFLLGDRLEANMVRHGAERAQVEAIFRLDESEMILRRELTCESSRTRLYINDKLHALDAVKDLRPQLVSMTSQHAQQALLQPASQSALIDDIFPDKKLWAERESILSSLHKNAAQLKRLEEKCKNISEQREMMEFQLDAIQKVNPLPGEEEELDELRRQIRAEKDKQTFCLQGLNLLYGENGTGLLDQLKTLEQLLTKIDAQHDALDDELENIGTLRLQLEALGANWRAGSYSEPNMNIDDIESRLFTLAQLKRKLKRTVPEILELREEILASFSFLDSCNLDRAAYRKEEEKLVNSLVKIQEKISLLKEKVSREFTQNLEAHLKELGFSEHVRVIADFVEQKIWPGVTDAHARLLWAPNPGQTPQPLDKIASGGELSRFLLALISMQANSDSITYIFDEVDSGVGGMTLNKLGDKLESLARKNQILLITHWPQLAARATRHFLINKVIRNDQTYTLCERLDSKKQQEELARMAGGGS